IREQSQKTGIEIPTSANTVSALSVNPPALIAEKYPNTKPKLSQMIAAPIHKDAVAGMPSSIRLSTLMWDWIDCTLPVKISFIWVQYCSGRDLSKPHSS